MKFVRIVLCSALAALLPAFLAGCGTDSQPRKTIGVSVLTLTHPFFIEITKAMAAEANKHGYELIIVSGEFDIARQNKQVQDFLVKRVDAIVLCPCNSISIGPVIQDANTAGVPVFTVDIGCLAKEAKVITHVATDNLTGGKQAAELMIEALGPAGGKIAIIDHPTVESCMLRVQGFKEVIDGHNKKAGVGKIEIVKELPGGGSKDLAHKAAEDMLQAHDDLAGIFCINDPTALGARVALEKANRAERVKIIGFDGQEDGKRAIWEGKIYGDPIQFPDKLGHETARAIIRYFEGEEPVAVNLILPQMYRQADAIKEFGPR